MKQRTTYIVCNPDEFNPDKLHVFDDSFSLVSVDAAKEHRLTFSLSELPQELYRVLRQCHELHIRWASEQPYSTIPPFVSHISPGLHAFFTPQKDRSPELLCPSLKKIFGDNLECESPKETFVNMPILSERFSSSSTSQYYQLLPSLDDLVTYIQQSLCPKSNSKCQQQASTLGSATYVDFDYDTISHALILNAFWAREPSEGSWTESISLQKEGDTIEVGVLTSEKAVDKEDLAFSGFLTVVGEDSKPSTSNHSCWTAFLLTDSPLAEPTRFQFPSRHHPLPQSTSSTPLIYTTSFKQPTGLHPSLALTFPASSLTPPDETCALHTYLTLPSFLFIDKYQLSDPLFLASLNLVFLRSISGATDLEAPDWVISQWGSAALLELAIPPQHNGTPQSGDWEVSIPLHLRYLPPNHNKSGLESSTAPWPVVFWACRAEEGSKMAVNPFDRVNLGYDGLFGPKTMFYHVPPTDVGGLVERIEVPVLDLDRAGYVEWGTVVAVVLGVAWVCWRLGVVVWRDYKEGATGVEKEAKKKQ
ncbi:PIG-X-domain-containing protein [Mytilinidion resinicola]|uniref:Protein PBN1 n=1 Tax=Mytilinidion resinicola TaxID=574789 RepID=A0A6A6YSZ7_9PEZI|nr:PIG-X-domain-containing protein [Mytilinidion resinicola]KAF2811037.1 PIG-X-domain-containing protein [Mytilinidion resinicola]